MSLILGIDACEFALGLSLLKNGVCQFERSINSAAIAENIISEIDILLAASGNGKRDLSLIAVAVGPGSFTGVRSSIAVALGLSIGLSIPVVGVSTLLGRFFANSADIDDGNYLISMRANDQELFCLPVSLHRTVCRSNECVSNDQYSVRPMMNPFCCNRELSANEALNAYAKIGSVGVQPSENISYFCVDRGRIAVSPAMSVALTGMYMAQGGYKNTSLKPIYVKGVNAKTLVERGKQKDI